MYSKFIRLDLNKFRQGGKNLKLQLCRQHFIVEALLVIEPPNIVPPSIGVGILGDWGVPSTEGFTGGYWGIFGSDFVPLVIAYLQWNEIAAKVPPVTPT